MSYSWIALFSGALLDALIGPNLLVPGEPFLLAAGYQLYSGLYDSVIAVILGGFIGDQISYWIGRQYGQKVQRRLIRWKPHFSRLFARTRLFIRQNGNKVLVFARLLGPIAWIVPFMVGTQNITWKRFSLFATMGLFLGMGQFIIFGYFIAMGIDAIPVLKSVQILICHYLAEIIIVGVILIILWGLYQEFLKNNSPL